MLRRAIKIETQPISASTRRSPIAPPTSSASSKSISASSICAASSRPTSGSRRASRRSRRDPRYAFMFGSLTVQDTMAQVLSRMFRVPVNGKPITILELGGLPSEIINVVVSVLARLAFDFGVWSARAHPDHLRVRRSAPLRADRQARSASSRPSGRFRASPRKAANTASRCASSPSGRPSSIRPSCRKCNTIFSLRLTNERDQEILQGRHFGRRGEPPRIHADHGHRRGHHLRRRRGAADAHQVRHAAGRMRCPKSNTASFTAELGQGRPRRELPA